MIHEVCACKAEFKIDGDYLDNERLKEWREHHAKVCPFRSERIDLGEPQRVEVSE